MAHVQIEISIAVESEHLLHHSHRQPFRRRLPLPSIKQSVVPALFVALSPAPHLSIANADDLGGLPPRDPFRHGSQNHFLYFHRPLHCGLPVTEHASHVLLPSPPETRTDHVLSQPDISCANDIPNSASARPTCVRRCRSTLPPTFGVSQKWLPRSLYNAQNNPLRSTTARSAASTVAVDSSSTNCAYDFGTT